MDTHPDQQYIDQIRSALWNRSGKGLRAALMVGAGMSMNAIPLNSSVKGFPTWAGLMDPIVNDLYPKHSSTQSNIQNLKERAKTTSEALRLANEYEATFTKSALNNLIKTAIPDTQFIPGILHEKLMELRWRDVYTTNWDTLLERTANKMQHRGYSVVRGFGDIPITTAPRIIKLHGSLPSNEPFIFTEEEFRAYPRTHAPFVNMVQQSIMENILVLIGFSGEDPNFLHWSGWVRDNLGDNRPPIYLVTLDELSTGKKRLLHDRKIVPIEVGRTFDRRTPDWAAKCLEWFLINLEAGQPPNLQNWPEHQAPTISSVYHDMSLSSFEIFDFNGGGISL